MDNFARREYDGEIDFQYGSTYFETVVIIGNEE